jgi:hypothetical protein
MKYDILKRQGYGSVTNGLTSASDSFSNSASNATSSLSRGETIGVAVGIIAFIALSVGLTWYCCILASRRREKRNAIEQEEIRQKMRNASLTSSEGGLPTQQSQWQTRTVSQPGAAMTYQDFLASQRRGSEPATDEDYWKQEPLKPTEHGNGSYIVDFDVNGKPQYRPIPQHQAYPPNYYAAQTPIPSPNERR